ncbi:MAG TPA: alpha/beta hydrolase [Hyphomonadaceae bacterium]|nr:alpha/beta hydrolase [Hyphomonadaceae bacterium]
MDDLKRPKGLARRVSLWLCGLVYLLGSPATLNAQTGAVQIEPDEIINLWPGPAPGAPNPLPKEEIVFRNNPFNLVDRAAHNVVTPNLSLFRPKKPNGAAILIIPGGGYSWVVIDKEGYEGAKRFAAVGYTVYVLRHRLPHQGWVAGPDTPLQDTQRAMRLIRSRAGQDGIQANKVMVMGFSAGGHVAGSLALKFDQVITPSRDGVDALSAKPDLAVLMYPVVTMTEPFRHPKSRENMIGLTPSPAAIAAYSLETNMRADAPPLFILHAEDDPAVPVENALLLHEAARRSKVSVTLHLFEKGGHGFGLRGIAGTPLALWPDLVLAWAQDHGFPKP